MEKKQKKQALSLEAVSLPSSPFASEAQSTPVALADAPAAQYATTAHSAPSYAPPGYDVSPPPGYALDAPAEQYATAAQYATAEQQSDDDMFERYFAGSETRAKTRAKTKAKTRAKTRAR